VITSQRYAGMSTYQCISQLRHHSGVLVQQINQQSHCFGEVRDNSGQLNSGIGNDYLKKRELELINFELELGI